MSNPDQDSQLEQEFQQLCESVQQQIEEKLEQARILIREAVDLSEQHGVPFRGNSLLSDSYMPDSFFNSKFRELDSEAVSEIAGVWGDYLFDGGGWQHSAIC